jgi:acetyl-CoA carboxylase biotin carboxyl carrier protein
VSADAEPQGSEDQGLAHVRAEVEQLVRQLDGPVARVRVRSGEAMIEIEWSHMVAGQAAPPETVAAAPAVMAVAATAAVPTPQGEQRAAAAAATAGAELHAVRAPLVGTFYVASEPNAAPFVRPGDLVDKNTTIGIIEAMKMMNHITAEREGRIAELLVGDGEAVEFGQELVLIEPMDS